MLTARPTVRELMIVVGLICVLLGAFRFHFSLGCFVSGTMAIAAIRISEKLQRLRSTGRPIRDLDRFWIFGKSLVVASLLLAVSLLPSLCLFPGLIPDMVPYGCRGRSLDPLLAVMMFAILGWPISVAMRRLLW